MKKGDGGKRRGPHLSGNYCLTENKSAKFGLFPIIDYM